MCIGSTMYCYHTAFVRGTISSAASPKTNRNSSSWDSGMAPSTFVVVVKLASLAPASANVISSPSSWLAEGFSGCAKPMSTSSPMDAMKGGSVDARPGLKCRVGVSAKDSPTVLFPRLSSTLRRFRRKWHARTDVTLGGDMFAERQGKGEEHEDLNAYGSMKTETRLDVRRTWFTPVSVRMVCRMLRIANGLKSVRC